MRLRLARGMRARVCQRVEVVQAQRVVVFGGSLVRLGELARSISMSFPVRGRSYSVYDPHGQRKTTTSTSARRPWAITFQPDTRVLQQIRNDQVANGKCAHVGIASEKGGWGDEKLPSHSHTLRQFLRAIGDSECQPLGDVLMGSGITRGAR